MIAILTGVGLALALGTLSMVLWLTFRRNAYQRLLKYDPRQDCVLGVASEGVETISTACDSAGFTLPALPANAVSVCLELRLQATVIGSVFDPSVEISCGNFHDRQFFERGVNGTRLLNLTRLIRAGTGADEKVRLLGSCLTWPCGTARLHICHESVRSDDRVLVIAPHPDDAELAAFGLYADTRATVVTITAGDASDRYSGDGDSAARLSRGEIARMRVLDSLTVPRLGGVKPEHALNLCYPDGKLAAMRLDRSRDFCCEGIESLDFKGLRQLNRSLLVREKGACSWESLITDLGHIISEMKPTLVVTPHPWLDPHSDHQFTTLAVNEALGEVHLAEGRFYFYMNHNRRSELWPFGPAGSGVAMLPLLPNDVVGCESYYSHVVSSERQREKLIALESMHDLRDVTTRGALRGIRAEVAAALRGMGSPPTSYLRRAVRPDELFFATSFKRGLELCNRVVGGA